MKSRLSSSSSSSSSSVVFVLLGRFFFFMSLTHALRPYRYIDLLNRRRLGHRRHQQSNRNQLVQPTNRKSSSSSSSPNNSTKNNDQSDWDDVQELFFPQRLDHFDPLNVKTYPQRYFYTNRFIHKTKEDTTTTTMTTTNRTFSVTFLCVGGEGPGFDKGVLVDSVHCTGDMIALASKIYHDYQIDVHLYALEHRYYGKSYPTFGNESPVETHNLKYLSSKQALEDLAHFVQTMQSIQLQQQQQQQEHPQPTFDRPIWITFGGSYPGYMSGNARLKHPQLIFAAVSSSVPLDLKVDFPEYNERVGWDLQYDKIGGSLECFSIVKQGHEEAVALIQNGNASTLASMFHVCHPETALDSSENQKLFLGDGLMEIFVQGNDPSCQDDLCNVDKLCSYMIERKQSDATKTNLDVVQEVAMIQRGGSRSHNRTDRDDGNDEDCLSVDYQQLLHDLAQPIIDDGNWRSWLWQTCTEVGFYQTCIHETCPYATYYHTVDQDLTICQVAYNITNVDENVQATRDYYGGLDISAGSRILSVNGNVDPWSVLGLHTSPKYSLPVTMVAGASHHFWTHEVKDTDSVEIQQVRDYIYSTVLSWLGIIIDDDDDDDDAVDNNHDSDDVNDYEKNRRSSTGIEDVIELLAVL